ncbi:MAG: DoxX family protein [Pseudomonadota bacterium]
MNILNSFTEQTYAAFRVVTGFLFLCHGTQKLFSFPISFPYDLNPMSTAAGIIEIVAGALIIVGFYSRFAAFIASGTMAVGYWLVHGLNHPFPIANGGEITAFYSFAFLYMAAKGPGIWAINKR